ncbi:MAG: hypothetical protein ACXADY_14730 [Candidatus Hodarchaeales archaeon]|jgi:hypothetical protein
MLEFIVDPLLPLILMIAGIIGLVYGIDKLMKSKRHESALYKYLALATSIVIGIVNLIAIYEWLLDTAPPDVTVHWLTILLIFLAGSSMLAEPLKETPLAAILAIIVFGALAGLIIMFADFREGISNIVLFGVSIPLWLVIILIVIIVGIVFLASVFTEFTIDRVLQLASLAPVVIILSALLLIQGLLMFFLGEVGGIWALTGL